MGNWYKVQQIMHTVYVDIMTIMTSHGRNVRGKRDSSGKCVGHASYRLVYNFLFRRMVVGNHLQTCKPYLTMTVEMVTDQMLLVGFLRRVVSKTIENYRGDGA